MCIGCAAKGLFGYGEDDDAPAILTPLIYVTAVGLLGLYGAAELTAASRRKTSEMNRKLFYATYKPFLDDKISKINIKISLAKLHSKESQSRYYVTRAKYYMLLLDKTEDAVNDLMTAVKIFPANAEALALLASLQMRSGQYEAAIASFSKAIEKLPEFKASKTIYRKARELFSAASDELDTQATLARDSLAQKLVPLTTISTNQTVQSNVKQTLALNQQKVAQVKQAMKYLEGETKDLVAKRAAAYYQQGDFANAIKDFTAAIQLPGLQKELAVTYRVPLAISLIYEKRYQESLTAIHEAMEGLSSCCASFVKKDSIRRKLILLREYLKTYANLAVQETEKKFISDVNSLPRDEISFFPYRLIPQELMPSILVFLPKFDMNNVSLSCRYMHQLVSKTRHQRRMEAGNVVRKQFGMSLLAP